MGQQIVDAFRTLGSNVIVLDIIKPKNSDNIEFYKCDITKENEVKKVSLKIIKKNKKIDILINNAAADYMPSSKIFDLSLENLTLETWKKRPRCWIKWCIYLHKDIWFNNGIKKKWGNFKYII